MRWLPNIGSYGQAAFLGSRWFRLADCQVLAVRNCKPVLWTIAVLGALGALAGAAVVYGGLYNVAATAQHIQPVHAVLETTMRTSVQHHARDIVEPKLLKSPKLLLRGAACFQARCVQCHGGPGVPADVIGMAMQPLPGSLIGAARSWRARELYWITRHGIKMSGMPAWQYHLSEADLWAVVAFVQHLPTLTPTRYGELTLQAGQCHATVPPEPPLEVPLEVPTRDPDAAIALAQRGQLALRMYGCHACHLIPGITGAQTQVGPPLAEFARRQLIAGRLAHTHDNLVAWIRHPQRIDAHTAMPDLGVTQAHAREMAEYLATLR